MHYFLLSKKNSFQPRRCRAGRRVYCRLWAAIDSSPPTAYFLLLFVFARFTVVIVGHSECGGAKACLAAAQSGDVDASDEEVVTVGSVSAEDPLNQWLAPLTRLAVSLGVSSVSPTEALPLLVDENVKAQVDKLSKSTVIQGAWAAGKDVEIHGLVYELATGELKDLGISQARK